ncbi:universal stress protein [Hymenobacter sp. GOD-10R]|uniref:universal stress protein n=1 Tax=Hymenobacter sp. GOD-10R TaxID=3093922 RepID=UPI002D7A33D5|nr:universal stress protein [Hymenobacter sp. GOD-10R]WRQ26897.1 universal stress protein [Hymenobacter sp. GOD-10R]
MKTVFVVLIDALEDASRIATFAAQLAMPTGAELVLLHVNSVPIIEPTYGMLLSPAEYLSQVPDLSETLAQLAQQLPVPATVESCQGSFSEVLHRIRLQYQPQLFVLGVREERAWLDRLMHNQTLPVLRDTRLPLLLVPVATKQLPTIPLKVLLAADTEPIHLTEAARALRPVLTSWKATFTVAHVSEPEAAIDCDMSQALKVVRTSGLLPIETDHGYHMQDASYAAGILRAATATQADLILLIARPRSFLSALFHHSVTAEVTRHTTIPVLLLPVEEEHTPLLNTTLRLENESR